MTDDSDDLDDHQDISAQKATEARREYRHQFQADQAALQRRQEEFNRPILAAPPEAWLEAAATAQHLIQPFPAAPGAQDPNPKELIAHVLDNLTRL
ncbi:MAG TPA: hypothetical protein VLS27_02520 [Gammaproteobacteria bacterium]|nr:hypothetical protein [Gammaproteobacteria bacterium]